MTPEQTKSLANALKARRLELGLSATEVAKRAGVDVATVTRLELAQIRDPRPSKLLAIAAVLGIEAAEIFKMAKWLPDEDLPSFKPYLRRRYVHLPETAISELHAAFDALVLKYGTAGPAPGEDEW